MNKKYYTSPSEQMVLETASDMEPIVVEDLMQAMEGMGAQVIRNALSSLAGKGRLYRVKRGVYLRCEVPYGPVIEDPAKLSLVLFPGYVAFLSALHHWRLIDFEPFTFFVATSNRSAERVIGSYTIKAVSMGKRAQGMVFDRGVYVSTLEKTVFDCLYKPAHSGGYNMVVRAISDASPDWELVLEWFDELGTRSLRQRAGFILSKAGNAPGWLLDRLKEGKAANVWLDPSGPRKGTRVREWGIIDNVRVRDAYG